MSRSSSRSLATSLALSAAALFLTACGKDPPPPTNPDDGAAAAEGAADGTAEGDAEVAAVEVKCLGINECAGESLCEVAGSHDCGGQNECQGKGWITVPQTECESKGGEIIQAEAEEDEAPAEDAAGEEAAEEPA